MIHARVFRRTFDLVLFIVLVTGFGCRTSIKGVFPAAADAPHKTIQVVSHGWHTGVIVARADIPVDLWPAQRDFDGYEFLEVGWGDDGFYRAEKITAAITLKAVFWPTPSVLHIVGFNGSPAGEYPASKLIQVRLSEEGFMRLCQFVDDAYTRRSDGRPIPLGPGLYGVSEFYRANGSYYFPRTCNYWTAAALRAAGCPIAPVSSVTATCLMLNVRRFGMKGKPTMP